MDRMTGDDQAEDDEPEQSLRFRSPGHLERLRAEVYEIEGMARVPCGGSGALDHPTLCSDASCAKVDLPHSCQEARNIKSFMIEFQLHAVPWSQPSPIARSVLLGPKCRVGRPRPQRGPSNSAAWYPGHSVTRLQSIPRAGRPSPSGRIASGCSADICLDLPVELPVDAAGCPAPGA